MSFPTWARRLLSLQVITILVALIIVAGAGLAVAQVGREGTTFTARFPAAIGLYPGSDVRVLGVRVGEVTAIEPDGATAKVTMQLDSGERAAADTGAAIIAPTLVSDRYVQLTEPYTDGAAELTDDSVVKTTAVPAEVDELYASLDDISQQLGPEGVNKNGALSRFLTVTSENLQGNGEGINTMITEFGRATGTLADSGGDFFATIENLAELSETLEEHDTSVAETNKQFEVVAGYLADDRDDLAAATENLSVAMADLEAFIEDNRDKLQSSVKKLQGPTQVLVNQRDSLEESIRTLPLALEGFLGAYNTKHNTIDGRGNLNELSLWKGKRSRDGNSVRTSDDSPPVLLPGVSDGSIEVTK